MHLYRLDTIGNLDGLGAREEAMPVPSAGEVLIRVKASALNFRDLAILMGKSPFPVRPGVVPISDAAGEVEAVGPDVSTLKVGDRVVSRFFRPGTEGRGHPTRTCTAPIGMAGSWSTRLFERRRS